MELKMSHSLARTNAAEKSDYPQSARLNPPDTPPDVSLLTGRELAVCALMVAGFSNKVIANRLDVGLRTVEACRTNATAKLELGQTPLIVWAALHLQWLPDVRSNELMENLSSPAAKAPASTRRRYVDPTPEEIAERKEAIRQSWTGGEPCFA